MKIRTVITGCVNRGTIDSFGGPYTHSYQIKERRIRHYFFDKPPSEPNQDPRNILQHGRMGQWSANNRRTLLLLVLWYSFFMLVAVVYYSRVRWKEDSHLIRVYNSLFVYPSAVPVTRQTYKNGQRPPSLLHSKHFDKKLPEYLMEDIQWQPFDSQTGKYRYRYDPRYAKDPRTRASTAWLGLGNVTSEIGRMLYEDVFVPEGFEGNLTDYLAAMQLYQETVEKVIKARTNHEAPGSTPLTIPDQGQLQQLELGRKLVLSHQDELPQTNSSVLLAKIEENMQQIRKETELSLQRLAELTNILNSPNGSEPNSALLGQLRLNATQLQHQLLLGTQSGYNLTQNASIQYMLDLHSANVNRASNVDMQMKRGKEVSANEVEKPMQRVKITPPKDQSKTAPDRPGLWGYLTGGGPVLKQAETNSQNKQDKFSATRKAAEALKGDDPDVIRKPPVQMPEVEGYYLLETRTKLRLRCKSCAVISSSGQLINSSAGAEIDQYPCVIRMNGAPVSGFQEDVGSRTTARVMGHVNLMKLNQSSEEQFEIFTNNTTKTERLVIPWLYNVRINKRRDKYYNIAKNFSKVFSETEFYVLSSSKMAHAENIFKTETGITRKEAKTWLSTGWMTLLFALDVCDDIDVFGLVSDEFCKQHPNDTTPYHYYEEKDGKKECEYYQQSETHLTFGHLFITEKAIFARWARRYNIDFRYPEWNASSYNTSAGLDTPFLKLYKESQYNKTLKESGKKGRGPSKPKGPPIIGPKTKEDAEKEKYQKFTHAVMFIVAIFLSLVVFLLLFLLVSIMVI